ncbi:MAG: DUF11 domain-containing protein [Sphingomonadales bacterium]|nr:DUF11 domain-containing protein [Sphingomonadales bacterium]
MTFKIKHLVGTSAVALAALASAPAFAAGTASGSTISNTATLNYTVGGVAQTAINANNVITVDRKVNLTVVEVGSATTSVVPGQTSAVTKFTVTNTSNATIDIDLAATHQAGGAAPWAGGTDNFDVTNVKTYIDHATLGTAGTYDVGIDVEVTYLDELAADASKTVYVVADVPIARVNNDISAIILTGTAEEGGSGGTEGAVITATAGANTAGVDTVLADAAGTNDAAYDGKHSAKDDYKVAAPVLTVAKLSRPISDPVNGTTNPKMIPGAVVEYCITVANAAGGATANSIVITDPLPAQTTYTAYGVWEGGTVAGSVCSGGTNTGTHVSGTVTGNVGTLTAGQTKTVYFRVTIN